MNNYLEMCIAVKEFMFSWQLLLVITLCSGSILLLPDTTLKYLMIMELKIKYGHFVGLLFLFSLATLFVTAIISPLLNAVKKRSVINESPVFRFITSKYHERLITKKIIPVMLNLDQEELSLFNKFSNSNHLDNGDLKFKIRPLGSLEENPNLQVAKRLCRKGVLEERQRWQHYGGEDGIYKRYTLNNNFKKFLWYSFGNPEDKTREIQLEKESESIKMSSAINRFLMLIKEKA